MTVVYRACPRKYSPRSGTGAKLYGGRWNPKGCEVIYTAATASLGALEILANYEFLPVDFTVTEIRIPDHIQIERISDDQLPVGWDDPVPKLETQLRGARWVQESRTAVLSVPSSVMPLERNFVLNPVHRDFEQIEFLATVPLHFDPRLKALGPTPS